MNVSPSHRRHDIANIHLRFLARASRWMSAASSAELQLPGTFIYFSTSPVFKFPGSCSDHRPHLCAAFLEKRLNNGILSSLLLLIIRPQMQTGEAVHSEVSRELCNARNTRRGWRTRGSRRSEMQPTRLRSLLRKTRLSCGLHST